MDIINLGNLFLGDQEDPEDLFWWPWWLQTDCDVEEYNNDSYCSETAKLEVAALLDTTSFIACSRHIPSVQNHLQNHSLLYNTTIINT